jgi:hypothetical protein
MVVLPMPGAATAAASGYTVMELTSGTVRSAINHLRSPLDTGWAPHPCTPLPGSSPQPDKRCTAPCLAAVYTHATPGKPVKPRSPGVRSLLVAKATSKYLRASTCAV